jgi:1-acyl-sn-glycerol-3-phosphate acyltransferase
MGIYTIPVAYSIWFVGLFNKFTKAKYYIAQSWTIPWMWAARSKVTLIKNYEYKKNQPYVVISNHLSNLDPMMQFRYLKIKWVFMAKKEVYKLPFFPRRRLFRRQNRFKSIFSKASCINIFSKSFWRINDQCWNIS